MGMMTAVLGNEGVIDADRFWRDGYLILRGALPPNKVARWREAGLTAKKQDLLSNDELAEAVCEPVLIDAARQILGGDPVYFGDSTAMRGTFAGCGFHKDCSDRADPKAPDWQVARYPIIRFGIYTQSHGDLPFGLDLRKGSHNYPDCTSGEMVSADVEPGDVVVWNGRTTHSGNSMIYKWTGRRLEPNPTSIEVRLANRLGGPWLFKSHPQERLALFISYALESPSLDRHIEYLRQRQYAVESWARSEWSQAARQMAAEAGLKLVDVTKLQHDGRELHRFYRPIPYEGDRWLL